jgi:hypothetical protein
MFSGSTTNNEDFQLEPPVSCVLPTIAITHNARNLIVGLLRRPSIEELLAMTLIFTPTQSLMEVWR